MVCRPTCSAVSSAGTESHRHAADLLARKVSQSRLWTLSSRLLHRPTPSTRWSIRYSIPESSQTVLSSMRRHLLSQIEPTRLYRWRIFRHHLPPHALHGLSANDSAKGPTYTAQQCIDPGQCGIPWRWASGEPTGRASAREGGSSSDGQCQHGGRGVEGGPV